MVPKWQNWSKKPSNSRLPPVPLLPLHHARDQSPAGMPSSVATAGPLQSREMGRTGRLPIALLDSRQTSLHVCGGCGEWGTGDGLCSDTVPSRAALLPAMWAHVRPPPPQQAARYHTNKAISLSFSLDWKHGYLWLIYWLLKLENLEPFIYNPISASLIGILW